MNSRSTGLLACVVALQAGTALAEDYPTRPITLIVPFAAGGPTDTLARLLGQSMSETLKKQVIVENVVGAGGTIGATRAAKSKPDGYTLFLHHIGQSTAPTLYRKLEYDPVKDFDPVGEVADVPMTIVAKKDFAPKDAKELISYLKANQDKVTLANAGLGAASHLCGLLFMSAIQAQLTTVPYKGTGPAMNDLIGGQIDLLCDQTTNTLSHIKGGKIKVYAVTTKKRLASLPEVPTLQEAGLKDFEVLVWHGLYVPKGTPKPVIDKLVHALQVALKDQNVKARLAELNTEPASPDRVKPEALRKRLESEIAKWAPVIKKAGQYAD